MGNHNNQCTNCKRFLPIGVVGLCIKCFAKRLPDPTKIDSFLKNERKFWTKYLIFMALLAILIGFVLGYFNK